MQLMMSGGCALLAARLARRWFGCMAAAFEGLGLWLMPYEKACRLWCCAAPSRMKGAGGRPSRSARAHAAAAERMRCAKQSA
eukprot:5165022-Prymnesium_polylepis.1